MNYQEQKKNNIENVGHRVSNILCPTFSTKYINALFIFILFPTPWAIEIIFIIRRVSDCPPFFAINALEMV